jgi:serine/threonine-protein kinase
MKKIGKYDILSILGKGAMGIVYKALDPDINRKVAIKTIRFDLASEETDTEEIMERFMREAQAAGKLTHPNIITIFDVGREEDLTYIVMQLIEGPSLQRLIAQGEKFPVSEVTKLMERVCSGLDYAHQNGIVHRDIKPGNVLLDNNKRPYICDFGVARVDTSTLTQSGTAVGTPSYMSPEQVIGKKIDKRSDIFSIGCILYEILTGRRPFEAESITTVIYKIINEEPPAISELKKGLPAGFEKIVTKALAKDPNDRYQNCKQLAEDLRNLDKLSDKTIAVTLTKEVPLPDEEEKEEEVPEKEKKKSRLGLILGVIIPAVLIIAAGGAYFYNEQTGKLPFVNDVVQKIGGLLGLSQPSLTIEEKLLMAKESFEKGDYDETVRLAEEVLAEDPGNTEAQEYLNKAKDALKPPPDPRELKLNEIKQSFDKGSYNETIRLADAFLAENPADTTALDFKNKAETQILINDTLQTGIGYYKKGRYTQSQREMEKIFTLEKDHKEARRYWNLSDRAIFESAARKEIKGIVENLRIAEQGKDLPSILYYIGSSSFREQKRMDITEIFNNFDDIQSIIEDASIRITFKDRTNAEVKFTNFSTAISKQTRQPIKIFEGEIIWTMQKQGDVWKIIREDKRE